MSLPKGVSSTAHSATSRAPDLFINRRRLEMLTLDTEHKDNSRGEADTVNGVNAKMRGYSFK